MICHTPMLAYMRCTTNSSIPISDASEINELLQSHIPMATMANQY